MNKDLVTALALVMEKQASEKEAVNWEQMWNTAKDNLGEFKNKLSEMYEKHPEATKSATGAGLALMLYGLTSPKGEMSVGGSLGSMGMGGLIGYLLSLQTSGERQDDIQAQMAETDDPDEYRELRENLEEEGGEVAGEAKRQGQELGIVEGPGWPIEAYRGFKNRYMNNDLTGTKPLELAGYTVGGGAGLYGGLKGGKKAIDWTLNNAGRALRKTPKNVKNVVRNVSQSKTPTKGIGSSQALFAHGLTAALMKQLHEHGADGNFVSPSAWNNMLKDWDKKSRNKGFFESPHAKLWNLLSTREWGRRLKGKPNNEVDVLDQVNKLEENRPW